MNSQEFHSLITEALASMTWLEAVAVLLGLAYVILAALENIWCWPAALVSVSIYIYLCMEAQLYAETGLQIFYWVMAIAGWWSWSREKRKSGSAGTETGSARPIPIITWSWQLHLVVIGSNIAGTFLLAWLLSTYTEAAFPLLDSFTTVFSLFTTWMVARKVLENWLYWIVIDAASVYLYASRDLYLTALLFILYTIIAAAGFWRWYRQYSTQTAGK